MLAASVVGDPATLPSTPAQPSRRRPLERQESAAITTGARRSQHQQNLISLRVVHGHEGDRVRLDWIRKNKQKETRWHQSTWIPIC
jgi:hypothetical protein